LTLSFFPGTNQKTFIFVNEKQLFFYRTIVSFNRNGIMKNKIGFFLLALMLLGLTMSGCRSHELCPAYTDSEAVTEEIMEENT